VCRNTEKKIKKYKIKKKKLIKMIKKKKQIIK